MEMEVWSLFYSPNLGTYNMKIRKLHRKNCPLGGCSFSCLHRKYKNG